MLRRLLLWFKVKTLSGDVDLACPHRDGLSECESCQLERLAW